MNTELEFIYSGTTDEEGYGDQPVGTGELKEGKTYTVLWDFEVYVCTCKKVVFVEEDGTMVDMFYVGSGAMIGGEDTGEPFICVYTNENGPAVWAMDGSAGHYYVLYAGAETEPTGPSFIEYLVNPKYRMGKPFRGIIGWKMARKGGSADESALVSSDGYTLQDVNGLNLITKESE